METENVEIEIEKPNRATRWARSLFARLRRKEVKAARETHSFKEEKEARERLQAKRRLEKQKKRSKKKD